MQVSSQVQVLTLQVKVKSSHSVVRVKSSHTLCQVTTWSSSHTKPHTG